MDQQTETSKPEPAAAAIDLKAETLSGDIRDLVLDQLRRTDKPWTKLSESEQRRIIESAEDMGRQAVRRALDIVLDYDFPTLAVSVGKYSGKDGTLKVEFTCADTDDNLVAVARAGRAVLIIAEPDVFFGQRRSAQAQPDQREMDLKAAKAAGEQVDPATGEVIRAGAPDARLQLPAPDPTRLDLPEAERRFKAASKRALDKKAAREAAGTTRPQVETLGEDEAVMARGHAAFCAGQGGIVPDDLAGTPKADLWLQGWDAASLESAERRKKGQPGDRMPDEPSREPAEA